MPRGLSKYDWVSVQRYYDEGHAYLQCRAKFGFASRTRTRDAVASPGLSANYC
jgi:hypothetical protein